VLNASVKYYSISQYGKFLPLLYSQDDVAYLESQLWYAFHIVAENRGFSIRGWSAIPKYPALREVPLFNVIQT